MDESSRFKGALARRHTEGVGKEIRLHRWHRQAEYRHEALHRGKAALLTTVLISTTIGLGRAG